MEAKDILKKYWGYDSFRNPQDKVIESVLQGNDTLALLPTGGGKSICYQVPALVMNKTCLVISPLIALMKDQAENLERKGISCLTLHSGLNYYQIEELLEKAMTGAFQFIFCSPERLQTEAFQSRVSSIPLGLIAVDEAHCVSQWGYDFRPVYLKIPEVRKLCPNVPLLALTATATPDAVEDIMKQLAFKAKNVIRKSFLRPNIVYAVAYEEDKVQFIINVLKRTKGTSIVYTRNRKKTAEIAEILRSNGISADFYHAGLEPEVRNAKQDKWMRNEFRVMVATNAFGMGIDKPDVRYVLHTDVPESPEAYFQEAGRAGRDEKKAFAILPVASYDARILNDLFEAAFPPKEEVVRVYGALANFLNIPIGTGKLSAYPLDISKMATNYNMSATLIYRCIKLLEKEGYFLFDESGYNPAECQILVGPEPVYKLGLHNRQYRQFFDVLLRSYPGLFAHKVRISTFGIASRLHKSQKEIHEMLMHFKKMEIVDYKPETELPELIYLHERIPQSNLSLTHQIYGSLKQKAKERLDAMTNYIQEKEICRSKYLTSYFGDNESGDCGACDVCIAHTEFTFSLNECSALHRAAAKLDGLLPMNIDEFLEKCGYIPNHKNIQLLRFSVEKGFFVLENEKIIKRIS